MNNSSKARMISHSAIARFDHAERRIPMANRNVERGRRNKNQEIPHARQRPSTLRLTPASRTDSVPFKRIDRAFSFPASRHFDGCLIGTTSHKAQRNRRNCRRGHRFLFG